MARSDNLRRIAQKISLRDREKFFNAERKENTLDNFSSYVPETPRAENFSTRRERRLARKILAKEILKSRTHA